MTCAYAVLKGIGLGLAVGLALFAFIVVFGYQHPAKIAGFYNQRVRQVALGIAWAGFWTGFLGVISGPCVTFTETMATVVVVVWLLVPVVLISIWAFYWNIPLFRRKTGIKVVDETAEWYRKPGEKAYVGHPRVVDLDGTRYVPVVYRYGPAGDVAAILAVREDTGEVVKDPDLMERLGRCIRIGDEMAGWPMLYRRVRAYKSARKALQGWPQALKKVRKLAKKLEGTPYEEDMKTLLEVWEFVGEYLRRLMTMMEAESEWAAAHGWEHMKEVRCEDLEPLDARLWKTYQYGRDHLPLLERGWAARERLLKAWTSMALPLKEGKEKKEFWKALQIMDMEKSTLMAMWEKWPKEQPLQRFPWTVEQRQQWKDRLEWGKSRRAEEVRAQARLRKAVRFLAWMAVVVGGTVALLSWLAGPRWSGVVPGGLLALLGWHFHEWEPKGR